MVFLARIATIDDTAIEMRVTDGGNEIYRGLSGSASATRWKKVEIDGTEDITKVALSIHQIKKSFTPHPAVSTTGSRNYDISIS